MEQRTHLLIEPDLVGTPITLEPGKARVALTASPAMAADSRGLVHGGFTFGLADYAAMCAVNDPLVVLGAAETRFLAPVQVGQEMVADAEVQEESGRKRSVRVLVSVAGREVMSGTFTCFVLNAHPLG